MTSHKYLLPGEKETTLVNDAPWLLAMTILVICLIYVAADFSQPWMHLLARGVLILAAGLLFVMVIKKAGRL